MKQINFCILLLLILIFFYVGCSDNSTETENHAPVIRSITANPDTLEINQVTNLQCVASDEDNDNLSFNWSAPNGNFPNGNSGSNVQWQASNTTGETYLSLTVSDGEFNVEDSIKILITILNHPPVIQNIIAEPETLLINQTANLHCLASDEDNDNLTYSWSAQSGQFPNGSLGENVLWQASDDTGVFIVRVMVNDGKVNISDSTELHIKIFTSNEKVFELGNTGVYITMVWIPPGGYMMGNPGTQGAGGGRVPKSSGDDC